MKTGYLFITTAIVEFMTGFALILFPSLTAEILLGLPISTITGTTVGRVAGAAIISLAVAFWLARNDEQSNAAKGLMVAMLLYNITVMGILAYTVIALVFTVVLLLVLITHFALTAWCIYALQKASKN
jgi:hypothetical protein